MRTVGEFPAFVFSTLALCMITAGRHASPAASACEAEDYYSVVDVLTRWGERTDFVHVKVTRDCSVQLEGEYVNEGAIPIDAIKPRLAAIRGHNTNVEFVANVTQKSMCTFDFSNFPSLPTSPYVVGLLVTKDDGDIVCEWLHHNLRHFDALIVVDGSEDPLTREVYSGVPNIIYTHEDDHQHLLVNRTDSEMRWVGQLIANERFGASGYWIHICHTDEFLYHSPRKVFRAADKAGVDAIGWFALHVIPHTSEYDRYLRDSAAPVARKFRHYFYMAKTEKGAFVESRSFKNSPSQVYSRRWAEVIPDSVQKVWQKHPAYIHYKLWNLTLNAYSSDGMHKHHWNKVDSTVWKVLDQAAKAKKGANATFNRGTGIRWQVSKLADFFKSEWPHCCKYKENSIYKGKIEPTLDHFGGSFVDRDFGFMSIP